MTDSGVTQYLAQHDNGNRMAMEDRERWEGGLGRGGLGSDLDI